MDEGFNQFINGGSAKAFNNGEFVSGIEYSDPGSDLPRNIIFMSQWMVLIIHRSNTAGESCLCSILQTSNDAKGFAGCCAW
jgi:hypothetical protein